MADITMCSGVSCPIANKCYRHTAVSGMRQSYFINLPYSKEKESCEYYWDNKNYGINNE